MLRYILICCSPMQPTLKKDPSPALIQKQMFSIPLFAFLEKCVSFLPLKFQHTAQYRKVLMPTGPVCRIFPKVLFHHCNKSNVTDESYRIKSHINTPYLKLVKVKTQWNGHVLHMDDKGIHSRASKLKWLSEKKHSKTVRKELFSFSLFNDTFSITQTIQRWKKG